MLAFSTRTHGAIDYALGALAMASPRLFGFADLEMAGRVAVAAGGLVVIYSLVTDHEFGAARVLPIPLHLWLDGLLGLTLGISPWLLEFDQQVWVPHVALGVLFVLMALFSQTIPGYERRWSRR